MNKYINPASSFVFQMAYFILTIITYDNLMVYESFKMNWLSQSFDIIIVVLLLYLFLILMGAKVKEKILETDKEIFKKN